MSEDVQFQIECLTVELVQMLMKEYGWSLERSFDELYNSTTMAKLNDPLCGLYYQGAVYVFDILKEEMETGRIG